MFCKFSFKLFITEEAINILVASSFIGQASLLQASLGAAGNSDLKAALGK
jgi:hypothetical protein